MRCNVVGTMRPSVWKSDDAGWVCDQTTRCLTCHMIGFDRLAEDATWDEAMKAAAKARPVESATLEATP